ncbi:hypothetical protein CMMCA001_10040 [Clavibacter michiganensis subsp. michiganensis]|nr:hypothetical protein CMMCA001_10040 [Clavibacter michiganensis subsp. michiganensis]
MGPSPVLVRPVTVSMPVCTRTPCAVNASATAAEIASSDAVSTRGATSSSVTSEPNERKTVTSCAPVLPAPMTASRRGMSGSASTSSGTVARSAPGTGRRFEWPPTHTMMAPAVIRRPLSSWSVRSSTKRARPSWTSVTPASRNRSASRLSERTRSTCSCTRATIDGQWGEGSPTPIPFSPAERTSRTSRAVFASTRVGTQPVLTHVPPTRPASSTTTDAPSSAARRAAAVPAGPAPMTATS